MKLPIYRTVKPTGNTCHVTVSKSMQGERVVVVHEDTVDEIRDCVMASIMLTGDTPSTALGSLAGFGADDIARFLDFYKKYVKGGGSINNELVGPFNNEIKVTA